MQAVIFDFDGTILDTETVSFECWRDTYAEHGLSLTVEMWSHNVGGDGYHAFHPFETLERLYGREQDWTRVHEARRARYHARVNSLDCIPGVREAIDEARRAGMQVAVASSSEAEIVRGHLERLGLMDTLDVISCGDEVEAIKPHPAVYLAALEKLGVTAREAFAIEDSTTGIAAAKAAGLYCIAIANSVTQALDLSKADRRITSLADIPFQQLVHETRSALPHAV